MAISWRRKRNTYYRRPDGTFVIESRLPLWQAVVGVVGWLLFIRVQLPLPLPAAWVAGGTGVAVLAAWAGAFSRLEIGAGRVVLRAGGWFGRTRRLRPDEVVLAQTGLTDGAGVAWNEANQRLHFEFASPFELDEEFLYITCRGTEVSHWFDDDFAWASLGQVAAQLRAEAAAPRR